MKRYKYQARIYKTPAQLASEASRLGEEGWRLLQVISEGDLTAFFERIEDEYRVQAHR